MRKRLLISTFLLAAMASARADYNVDFSRIRHWAGSGDNEAALVVQFLDEYDRTGYVWGFRWPDGAEPTGEEMIRAIAAESDDFCALIQFTGGMGSTLDGVGYSRDNAILHQLWYDYESAAADPYIMFGFDEPNTLMSQSHSPGPEALTLCTNAIEAASLSHIIEHPLNQRVFGYPAYDYDWWQPAEPLDNSQLRWNAGWYDGYWSYWVGGTDFEELSYSGLGMTSRKLSDGQVDAWKYTLLDGPVTGAVRKSGEQNPPRRIDAGTGASEQWHALNYSHTNTSTGVGATASDPDATVTIHTLQGVHIKTVRKSALTETLDALPGGCYIIKEGSKATKLIK